MSAGLVEAVSFDCHGAPLVGILHRAAKPARRGVVVIVGGGPQYRAGGHRQLVLWSRALAAIGVPVFRIDYRGMGDSGGQFRGFEDIDDDIRAAIDEFQARVPEVEDVVLWGECDASSAILFYAYRDPRVGGAVLLNPWARTDGLRARAVLRHYYLQRILEPSFWRKLLSGKLNPVTVLRSLADVVRKARSASRATAADAKGSDLRAPLSREGPLPDRLLAGLRRFQGPILLVMSGRDLIARELDELIKASPEWQAEIARHAITRHDLPEGDHTFSSDAQRSQVIAWGIDWLRATAPADTR